MKLAVRRAELARYIGLTGLIVAGAALCLGVLALLWKQRYPSLSFEMEHARDVSLSVLAAYFVGFAGAGLVHEVCNLLKGSPTLLGRFQEAAREHPVAAFFITLFTIGLWILGAALALAIVKGVSKEAPAVALFLGATCASEFSMEFLRSHYLREESEHSTKND